MLLVAERLLSAAVSTGQDKASQSIWWHAAHNQGCKRDFFKKIYISSRTELRLSCLDSSCDALSGHEMNSQVWLNNKELQSVAVLHLSVLGSDIKRSIAVTLSQMKKAGFSLLHNTWGKFPEIKALMQRWDSEESQPYSVPLRHNKHCANLMQSLSFPSHHLVITLEIMVHAANRSLAGLLNEIGRQFSYASSKTREKKQSKYIL